MAKPRPIELHVNSMGAKKHLKLQEMIHDEVGYFFIPIDGRRKTDLYNKGLLDGRKGAIPLFSSFTECSYIHEAVLAIPRGVISSYLSPKGDFIGVIQLDRTYLIDTREANRFIKEVCFECEYMGTPQCFKKDYRCAEEDRDKYRDTPYRIRQQEIRKARRKRTPFPG